MGIGLELMLVGLTLRQFTVIDELSISFSNGLNIVTGETGAGKSIIVDALNTVLGHKVTSEQIKTGEEEARVEALFDLSLDTKLKDRIDSLGFDVSDGELLIKRTIPRRGRGRVFLNGSLVTLRMLETITEGVVDIFSQHEHQSLLKEENHVRVLDKVGGSKVELSEYRKLHREYLELSGELTSMSQNQRSQIEKEDFLKFQFEEIDQAGLGLTEDSDLEEERKVLVHREFLLRSASVAYDLLYENERSVLGTLKTLSDSIQEASEIDGELKGVSEIIESSVAQIQDVAFALRDYASGLSFDNERLNEIEARLQDMSVLKRKYGGTIEQILNKKDELQKELREIESYDEKIDDLTQNCATLKEELVDMSKNISKKRDETAQELSSSVEDELKQVGIKGASFVVEIKEKELSSDGIDKVQFLFSANPDEKPKPLVRVASGGELSRIMLILKGIIANVEGGSVVIFDEADSGIGGAVAERVGQKISELSKTHQVICITHLPQVAKFAESHVRVSKSLVKNKTRVTIKSLNQEERIRELARMMGGLNITQKTLDAAREMLDQIKSR